MIDTRLRILLDTNVFTSAFILGSPSLLRFLDKLVLQQRNGLIDIVVPTAVQAEFYGILRAGRIDLNMNGDKRKNYCFTHEQIIQFIHPYMGSIFSSEKLDDYRNYSWPNGPEYKEKVLKEILYQEYGWIDWGQSEIERRLHSSVENLGLRDRHDYPIMAAGLCEGVDVIVTANMKDFIDPLGKIRVVLASEALGFDFFALHASPEDFDPPI